MLRFIFFFFFLFFFLFKDAKHRWGSAIFTHCKRRAGAGASTAPERAGTRRAESTRFPVKNDSLNATQKRGALSPITYLLFKLQRGQLKQLDHCHVQTDAYMLREAG